MLWYLEVLLSVTKGRKGSEVAVIIEPSAGPVSLFRIHHHFLIYVVTTAASWLKTTGNRLVSYNRALE